MYNRSSYYDKRHIFASLCALIHVLEITVKSVNRIITTYLKCIFLKPNPDMVTDT